MTDEPDDPDHKGAAAGAAAATTAPRVSLVTGASRGIGRALALALLARGDRVIAAVRDPASLEGLGEGLAGELRPLTMDVADAASVREAAGHCHEEAIDLLINNAGLSGPAQRAPGMDLERAERIVQVNALGPLRVYDAFAERLRAGARRGRAALVNVSSEAGSFGAFRLGSKPEYAMSKAALNMFTRWVAAQEPGVVCVSIHPGWVRTQTGGPNAPASPDEAAASLLSAIDRLSAEHSGGFYDVNLAPLPW